MEKRRLGRGLDALLGGDGPNTGTTTMEPPIDASEVSIERIARNPHQPRKHFDLDDLASLSASVREHGILQPLVVRQVDGNFQLIAGERRLRAAQEAGLRKVPVRIVDFNDQQVVEVALVENIQRSDLNAIEKAQGFKEYIDRFGVNHEQLAQRLGLARSSITNLVNLLEMAPEVQEGIRLNQISEAHAKLLKGVKSRDKQVALYKQIVAMGLSVKATETLIRDQKEGGKTATAAKAEPVEPSEKTAHVRGLEEELRQRLAVSTEIRVFAKDKGQIILSFASNDDFERLMEQLRR